MLALGTWARGHGPRPSRSSLTLVQRDRRAQALRGGPAPRARARQGRRPAQQGAGHSGTRRSQWLVVSRKVQTGLLAAAPAVAQHRGSRGAKGPARPAGCHPAGWTLPRDRPHPQDSQCLPAATPGEWQALSPLGTRLQGNSSPKLSLPGGHSVRWCELCVSRGCDCPEQSVRGGACVSSRKESAGEQRDGWQGTVRLAETGRVLRR